VYKNNAKACLNSKVRARLQRLIVLRTNKLASGTVFIRDVVFNSFLKIILLGSWQKEGIKSGLISLEKA
jgi:hypothetical protein